MITFCGSDDLRITGHTVSELQGRAYRILAHYTSQPQVDNLYDLEIDLLPWERNSLARRAITYLRIFFGKMPTVEQIVTYFTEIADSKGKLDIPPYVRGSLKITKKTFESVGIQLSHVEIK